MADEAERGDSVFSFAIRAVFYHPHICYLKSVI
jgi:hypothetical protein